MASGTQYTVDSTRTLNVLPDEFYTPFFSNLSKNRRADPIRALLPLEQRPGVISLLAGKPNAETFPITALQYTISDPAGSSAGTTIALSPEDLAVGLQYNHTAGLPELVEWVYGLQEDVHGRRKGEGWRVSIGVGSSDLIYKAVSTLVNPGDAVLIEAPVYAGIIPMFQVLDCEFVEVDTDAHGIRSQSLRTILENWPPAKPKPKVLYTVPYGCNPTGMTATLERRLEVLALAREHNFLILEDDAYFYLYFGDAPRPPSYFALDAAQPEVGRVVRFDSLSKVISSGMRIGFISAPASIVDAIDIHTQNANLQGPTFSQLLAVRLLQTWGHAGFQTHTARVAQFYRAKRDVFERLLRTHLAGLVEWTTPEAGMFFWFKLLLGDAGSPTLRKSSARRRSARRARAAGHGVPAQRAQDRVRARGVQPAAAGAGRRGAAAAARGHPRRAPVPRGGRSGGEFDRWRRRDRVDLCVAVVRPYFNRAFDTIKGVASPNIRVVC
ncbi:Kynurenine/alpha-aminoadipate aminotransferase, mitochondrial [Grifola frondosa]|uniref:Kynurenine/alpha-aminoadipate aminotransferase, mitochondrial n=1 Tax=Grifola frondosa TaxID=5627 RepID=A0A1C7LN26_GRIFR|nr:Kynurenine/alpha-aminoadipate aminotransferase, mitochondrial [Grifola frondosa]